MNPIGYLNAFGDYAIDLAFEGHRWASWACLSLLTLGWYLPLFGALAVANLALENEGWTVPLVALVCWLLAGIGHAALHAWTRGR